MAPIIRTCSAVLLLFGSVAAEARQSEPSAVALYVRARIADARDQSSVAISNYSAALSAAPDNSAIAFRAYREAVEAGDFPLALRSATSLERNGLIPPDAHLVLLIGAMQSRDWPEARKRLDVLDAQPGLGFMAPMLARWVDVATRSKVDLNLGKSGAQKRNAYWEENEALISLAGGNVEGAVPTVKAMWATDPYRAGSLRLAVASQLTDKGRRDLATSLIISDDGAATRAKSLIGQRKKLNLSVTAPLGGVAFLFARIAGDLIVEGGSRSALTMARIASFAQPENPRIRLMVAGALAARKRHDLALDISNTVLGDPVYGDDAASFRIDQLLGLGETDKALAEANSRAVNSPNDLTRVGDIEMRRQNFGAAAKVYQQVLDTAGGKASWQLIFAAGNAFDAAGEWTKAKPLLERALVLAPDDPMILNELGYGLIINGGSVEHGLALIEKALAQSPDNAAMIDSLGWAHFQKGDFAKAIPLLERAVRLDKTQPEIGEHLGDAYWGAGRKIEARYAWTAARVYAVDGALARLDGKIAGQITR